MHSFVRKQTVTHRFMWLSPLLFTKLLIFYYNILHTPHYFICMRMCGYVCVITVGTLFILVFLGLKKMQIQAISYLW